MTEETIKSRYAHISDEVMIVHVSELILALSFRGCLDARNAFLMISLLGDAINPAGLDQTDEIIQTVEGLGHA